MNDFSEFLNHDKFEDLMSCWYEYDKKVKQGLEPWVGLFDQIKTEEELSAEIIKFKNSMISMVSDTEKVLEVFSEMIKEDEILEYWLTFIQCIRLIGLVSNCGPRKQLLDPDLVFQLNKETQR